MAAPPRHGSAGAPALTPVHRSCLLSAVRGTTVGQTTGPGNPGARAGAIRDVDLPTRMLVFGVAARRQHPRRRGVRRGRGMPPLDRAGAIVPAPAARRGAVRARGRRPTPPTTPPTTGCGPSPASGAGPCRPTPRTAAPPVGTGTGTWLPSPSPRPAAPPGMRCATSLGAGRRPRPQRPVRQPPPVDKDVVATAEQLGVVDHVTLARTDQLVVGGVSEPRELAARLWPIDDVAARYRAFLDRWSVALDHMSQMQRQRVQLPDSAFLPGARWPWRSPTVPASTPTRCCRPTCSPTPGPGGGPRPAREQPALGPAPAGRERPAGPVRHLRRPAPDTARRRRLRWARATPARADAGDDAGSEPGPHEPDDDHDSDDAAARHSPGGQQ